MKKSKKKPIIIIAIVIVLIIVAISIVRCSSTSVPDDTAMYSGILVEPLAEGMIYQLLFLCQELPKARKKHL